MTDRIDDRRRRTVEIDQPDAEDIEHCLGVEVLEALAEDRVHRDQQEDLEDRREAARQRVDAALAIELLLGLLDLDPVALVAPLDLLDFRSQHLGPPRRHGLATEDRDEDDPDDQRHQDDGDGDVARRLVEHDEQDEEDLEERREDPGQQVERVVRMGWSERYRGRRRRGDRCRTARARRSARLAGRARGDHEHDQRYEDERADPGSPGARKSHWVLS